MNERFMLGFLVGYLLSCAFQGDGLDQRFIRLTFPLLCGILGVLTEGTL
jgi:hypothetical protein